MFSTRREAAVYLVWRYSTVGVRMANLPALVVPHGLKLENDGSIFAIGALVPLVTKSAMEQAAIARIAEPQAVEEDLDEEDDDGA